jgi:hypothetical protein
MVMLEAVWIACLMWLRPLAALLQSCRMCPRLACAAAMRAAATLGHVLVRSYCYWREVAQAWLSPLELAACFEVVEHFVYEGSTVVVHEGSCFAVHVHMPEFATFAAAVFVSVSAR